MRTVSIIIPVYNEENTIESLLQSVFDQNLSGWKREIIIIDDGSKDKTRQILKKWDKKCIILLQDSNQGKGAAVQKGINNSKGDIVIIQDADLEYSPSDFPVLLEPFNNIKVTAVYGSRFLGPHLSTMFVYAQGNKFVTLITNILYNTNITDMETGYKAFRGKILRSIKLTAKRFDFEPEITAKLLRKGYQIYEVPISYYGRKFSEGKKLTWIDGVLAVWTLIKFRFYSA